MRGASPCDSAESPVRKKVYTLQDSAEQPHTHSAPPQAGFPGVSVQKQDFTRNPEKLAKVPGTGKES